MKTITVKLPRALAERLGRAVVQRRSTRSTLVREALEAQLAKEPGVIDGSCFELAGDLAGVADGPSDLSSNRARLKGYGR
jgi:predicted transcriptional regulator